MTESDNNFPKISVIVPVYNSEQYLPKCIDSVLDQGNIQLEVLLVNDGSTDNSGNICNDYSIKDKRIKVFHQANGGVSSARNKGIENATGDWICFVDADDWIEPNSLEKIMSVDFDNSLDILIARSFGSNNENVITERYPFKQEWIGRTYKGTDLFTDVGYGRGSVCGALYNRLFLINNNITFPLNLKNGEDSIFNSICRIYAEKISFSNIHLYNVYEREGSASRSWTFNRILNMVDNISYINNYIDSHTELTLPMIHILNYSKYGVVSNIYNNFHHSLTKKNYLILRRKIKNTLNDKIDTGNIKTSKNKVRILNFSLDLFAILVLLKNKVLSF